MSPPPISSTNKNEVMQDDMFESAMVAYQNLVDATSTLRATALLPSQERGHKVPLLASLDQDIRSVHVRLDHEEHVHIREQLPKLYRKSRACVQEVEKERKRLEEQDQGALGDMIQVLSAIRDQANRMNAAASSMLKLTKAALTPEKKPNRVPEQDPLPDALDFCQRLGGAIAKLDETLDQILKKCDGLYGEYLHSGHTSRQASIQRTIRQAPIVIKYLQPLVETAQQCEGNFGMKLREVDMYRRSGGEVDKEVWEGLNEAWKDHLKRIGLFERILFDAAKNVLQTNE